MKHGLRIDNLSSRILSVKKEVWIKLFIVILICSYSLYIVLKEDQRTEIDTLRTNVKSSAVDKLPKKGKLFCWVQTSPKYHKTRVPAVNSTWLTRCDHGQFFSSETIEDSSIPHTVLFESMEDSWYQLYRKTRYAFYHIYTSISSDFEWYLKADDDTYVIVEHLLEYLSTLNSSKPYLIGHTFKPFLEHGYVAGGAYAISKEALKIYAEQLYNNTSDCLLTGEFEDLEISRCFASKNIFPIDTRNSKGQQRFHPESPLTILNKAEETDEYAMNTGEQAFGIDTITFHHLKPSDIRILDAVLYKIKSPQLSEFFNKKIND